MAVIRCKWVFLLLAVTAFSIAAREVESYAFVNDDATLTINNRRIHLHGIHIPQTPKTCQSFLRPAKCAPGAALALDFKIQGFVRCDLLEKHPDRTFTGRCFYRQEDLGAYLLSQGWALALPDAPMEYQALEKIARHHRLGLWGNPGLDPGMPD